MPFTVSEEIFKRTVCEHQFSCLNGESRPVCMAVSEHGDDTVLTTCGKDSPSCKYCMVIGETGGNCACPTRVELFKRYGI